MDILKKLAAADVLGLHRAAGTVSEGKGLRIVVRPEQPAPAGAFASLKPYLPGILLALAIILIPWAVYFLNHS